MPEDKKSLSLIALMHLLQMSDSAFPVGTFSFSNGLETAAYLRLVHDASTLEAYTRTMMRQAAGTDGLAALISHRAASAGDRLLLVEADHSLLRVKMSGETRQMLCRMGRKMAELVTGLLDDELLHWWTGEVSDGRVPGCYPIAQGMVAALAGISEESLFCSHQYGVMNMVLSAALRLVRVSHYDTQTILFRLSGEVPDLYEAVRLLRLDEMSAFAPQADILASLHEKGKMRMFMN